MNLRAFLPALSLSLAVFAVEPYQGGDTSGCGKIHPFNGLTHYHTLESLGEERTYSIHLPYNYDAKAQYPLVLGFHGSSSVGLFFEVDTLLSMPAFSADKILLYPDGINGSWAGPSYAVSTIEQDLQWIHDILEHARSEYCIDSARVYATGMSNGGGFLDSLACNATVGGEFAAFAPAAGSYYTEPDEACQPARKPMPILEFHGGSDKSVHYEGGQGEGGIEPSISDWLGLWAKRNECDGDPKQEDSEGGKVHHLTFSCFGDQGEAALQHWKVDDMGHVWPSTELNFSQIAAGEGPTYISASKLAMEFFDRFVRPA
ncbi:carbohydrate esterase family 1 protein [Cylindrobasidium torrendii FP15055 ss-10]|uniref:feruloyl esterase n=1 Tax=Cylindrobasidium torrendii FP15055 ss-10 TaxID=1314674 RepID=A0A0D7BEG9_9AGAR|nr:carbohydrate esterase family 1 protein [Cylindrobasidium torrendii FP15055 ss-10]